MRKKMAERSATPATSIDQLEAEVSTFLREIDDERRSLRPLIMRGDDSAPTRQRIAALEAKLADAKACIDHLIVQRDARLANDVARDVRDLAGSIAAALTARLAALEPPQHPTKK